MVGTQTTEEGVLLRVAHNIGERRRALGMTQAQLAERLSVDTETLSRFERGKHAPTLKNLIRLASLLKTTVADLLVEERPQPSEDATIVSAWLEVLSPGDRDFAMVMLKQYCDYLVRRPAAVAADAAKTVAFPDVAQAMVCPVDDLQERLDNVMSLIEHGLRIELVSGSRRVFVTKATAALLFETVPAVRDRVIARFPASAAEGKTKALKPKKSLRAAFSEKPSGIQASKGDRPEVFAMSSATADAQVSEDAEVDDAAIPRKKGLPSVKSVWRVAEIVEAEQLSDRLDAILMLLDEGKAVRVDRDSKTLGRVELSTVYKLYWYEPRLRDVILARYPGCVAQELADQKQEAKDLRAYQPKQVPTSADKKATKAKRGPDSWEAVLEEDQTGVEGGGDTEPGE